MALNLSGALSAAAGAISGAISGALSNMSDGRNFNNNSKGCVDNAALAQRFETMLYNVNNMIKKESTYSTWIRFQLGTDENKSQVTFNTTSQNPKQNLIAYLQMKKSGAGVANKFELKVKYDPFNFGQNPSDQVEALDNILATALSFDFSEDSKTLRGYIQYGYNFVNDLDLVSPKYQCIVTEMNSSTKTDSGITEYTFKGTSEIALDSEFTPNFKAIKDAELVRHVGEILYYYYGDPANPPSFLSSSAIDGNSTATGSLGYSIEIPDKLLNNSITKDFQAKTDMTPLAYCNLMLEGEVSKSDKESGNYEPEKLKKDSDKPRYIIYLTDTDNNKAIHLEYVNPDSSIITINFKFTWSNDSNNLVTKWEPNVDLRLYLLQKAIITREGETLESLRQTASDKIQSYRLSGGESKYDEAYQAVKAYEEHLAEVSPDAKEYPDATLTLVGIPSDIPIGVEIMIEPRILQSVSRTAGYYMIKGATDEISSNGVFQTKLDVIRLRGFNDPEYLSKSNSLSDELQAIKEQQSVVTTGGGGSSGGSGASRSF